MGLRAASRSNVASDLSHRQNKVKVHVVDLCTQLEIRVRIFQRRF